MRLAEVVEMAFAMSCGYRQAAFPFWTCDLPDGHSGDHAQVHYRPFK